MKQRINRIKHFLELKIKIVLPIFVLTSLLLQYNKIFGKFNEFSFSITRYFYSLDLNFLNTDIFNYHYFNDIGDFFIISILEIIFIAILSIGYVLYYFSKGKEKRLLQFCFSIFFILTSIKLILWLNFSVFKLKISFLGLLYFISVVFWLLFFYLIVKILEQDSKIKTHNYKLFNDYKGFNLKPASKWQRLFHLIIDAYLAIIVTSRLIRIFPSNFFDKIARIIGERYTLTLVALLFITFYYIVFEFLFKSTPAKYLTQTKVVSLTGSRLSFNNILTRSFARRIPFNPFSFLGESSQLGWHDSISKTTVVQLERQGKHGSLYWLIIPFFLAVVSIVFFTNLYLNKYSYYKFQENQLYNENYDIKRKLKNLKASDFITLHNTQSYYNFAYLKVSHISKDSIDCYVIKDNYNANTLQKAEHFYGGYYSELELATISKSDLENAICENFNYTNRYENCGLDLLKNRKAMRIKNIQTVNEPFLEFKEINYTKNGSDDNYSFNMELNSLNTITIETIECDNETVVFASSFPISGYIRSDGVKFKIYGSGIEPEESAIFKFFIQDKITHKRFIYQLEIEGKYKKVFKYLKRI